MSLTELDRSSSTKLVGSDQNAQELEFIGSNKGRLKTESVFAYDQQLDSLGRLRVSEHQTVLDFSHIHGPNSLLFFEEVANGGSSAYNATTASVDMTTTTASGSSVIRQTRYIPYIVGRSYFVFVSGNIGAKKTNVRQRVGYFDANDGWFFEQTGTELAVVQRTSTSGSPVDTRILQADWNIDKLDGTGESGVNLDTSKHQLYIIDFTWQGAGEVRFGILINGKFVYCHAVNNSNVSNFPSTASPSRPIRFEITNTGAAASSTTLKIVSGSLSKESVAELSAAYYFGASREISGASVNTTGRPVISIRPKLTFNGKTNRVPVLSTNYNILATDNTIFYAIYLNPTLTGATFNSAGANTSVEFDIAATAITGGTLITSGYLPATSGGNGRPGNAVLVIPKNLYLGTNIAASSSDIITVFCRSVNSTATVYSSIDWEEFR